jgi:hypothetical protein
MPGDSTIPSGPGAAQALAAYVLMREQTAKDTGQTDKVGQGMMNTIESQSPSVVQGAIADLQSMQQVMQLAPSGGSIMLDSGLVGDAINRLQTALGQMNGTGGTGGTGDVTVVARSFLTDGVGLDIDALVSVLAKAMIINSNQQQQNALQTALASREAARGELMQQAGQLNKEASDMRTGAIINLVVTVVTSAVSIGMSLGSMGHSLKAGGELADASQDLKGLNKTQEELNAIKPPNVKPGDEETTQTKSVDEGEKVPTQTKLDGDSPKTQNTQKQSKTDPKEEIDSEKTKQQAKVGKEQDEQVDQQHVDKRQAENEKLQKGKDQQKLDKGMEKFEQNERYATKKQQYDNQKENFDYKMKEIQETQTYAQNLQTVGQTIGNLGNSVGGAANTFFQADAKDDEAEGSRAAAEAQTLQAAGDYANSLLQKIEDNAKQIVQFLQAVQQSKSDEMRSITKG